MRAGRELDCAFVSKASFLSNSRSRVLPTDSMMPMDETECSETPLLEAGSVQSLQRVFQPAMDKLCNVSRCSCCVCAILQQCSVSTLSLTPWRHFLEEMHFGSRARHYWWWSMWSDSESLAATCSWSDIRTGHHQHCRHHHYQHQHHHNHTWQLRRRWQQRAGRASCPPYSSPPPCSYGRSSQTWRVNTFSAVHCVNIMVSRRKTKRAFWRNTFTKKEIF